MRSKISNMRAKYPATFGIVVGLGIATATAALAAAAWFVFFGVGGSGGSKVGSATISNALTLTPDFQAGDAVLIPTSAVGDVFVDIHNADPNSSERLTGLTVGSIVASPACDTSLIAFSPDPANVGPAGRMVAANGTATHVRVGTLSAPATLDLACQNSTITVNFSGGTTSTS